MTTEAQIGWGTRVFLQDASDNWVELDEVTDVGFPDDQVADIEATNYKSPQKRKEFIAGLIDAGTGDVVMNYVPGSATDVLCRARRDAGDAKGMRIDLLQPDSSYWRVEVDMIAKGYKRSNPIDNRRQATLTVRFTGAVTETDI
jgi:hypothetical protein